jgi:hypothetical protein
LTDNYLNPREQWFLWPKDRPAIHQHDLAIPVERLIPEGIRWHYAMLDPWEEVHLEADRMRTPSVVYHNPPEERLFDCSYRASLVYMDPRGFHGTPLTRWFKFKSWLSWKWRTVRRWFR